MRVSQIDLGQRVIRLEPGTTKNKEGREVLMTNAILQLLTALVEGKQVADCVFTRDNGKPVRDFRVTWQNACARAGVPGLLFHDLRRTAVRNMVRAGVPERVAMTVSGHKTRSIFDRYNIVNENDLREAMQRTQTYLIATAEEEKKRQPNEIRSVQ